MQCVKNRNKEPGVYCAVMGKGQHVMLSAILQLIVQKSKMCPTEVFFFKIVTRHEKNMKKPETLPVKRENIFFLKN